MDSNGNPITDSQGYDIVVQKQVQAIDVAPFTAEAGQIYLFGNQVQGTGTLNAPVGVNVNLTNFTVASLQIEGITVPQNIGGIYLNGGLLDDSTVAADNTAINQANSSKAGANFDSISLSQPPAPPAPGTPPSAHITITNEEVDLTQTEISAGITQPDIIINGAIDAVFASLSIFSLHDINVTQTAEINVYSQDFTSTNNVTIDEVMFYASGDPAGQVLGTPADAKLEIANGDADIVAYENTPQVGVNPQTGAQLVSQTIEIDSEYVDLNGSITAGQANETLTLDPSEIDSQIAAYVQRGASSSQVLTLSSADDPNEDFLVFYTPGTDGGQGSIEVQPVSLAGGTITIKGHIASTSTATLDAFGYYGDVNIVNNTSYNLVVDGVNVAQAGSGLVDITDYNQTDGNGNVLETKYVSTAGGGMSVSTNYVNASTDAAAGAGSVVTAATLVVTGSISGTTLTVTGITLNGTPVTANVLTAGDVLTGAGLLPGTTIVSQNTSAGNTEKVDEDGTYVTEIGGIGTYQLSTSQTASGQFSVSNSSIFQPEQGLRYNFTVEWGTQTLNTRTYSTSAWLGAINLGSSTNYDQGTPVVIGQPEILASSLYYYVIFIRALPVLAKHGANERHGLRRLQIGRPARGTARRRITKKPIRPLTIRTSPTRRSGRICRLSCSSPARPRPASTSRRRTAASRSWVI